VPARTPAPAAATTRRGAGEGRHDAEAQQVGQRVELGAEGAVPAGAPGQRPVHDVQERRKQHQGGRERQLRRGGHERQEAGADADARDQVRRSDVLAHRPTRP
jgi:hypothetical protein